MFMPVHAAPRLVEKEGMPSIEPQHSAPGHSDATRLNVSLQAQLTDSGNHADIDDINPDPIDSGRNRSRRRLADPSKFRLMLLKLMKEIEELDSWNEQNIFLQGTIASLVEDRECREKEMKEISSRLLELERLNLLSRPFKLI